MQRTQFLKKFIILEMVVREKKSTAKWMDSITIVMDALLGDLKGQDGDRSF